MEFRRNAVPQEPGILGKGIPWVKSGDLTDGPVLRTQEQITEAGLLNSSAKLLPEGTISLALYGATIGKLGVLTFQAATNQACANVVPDASLVDADYLFLFLLSQRRNLIEQGQGGAQPNISQDIVKAHPIVIPPLNEQRRIVAKLQEMLSKVDSCQKRLARIPVLLKRFRQSVIAAACSSRLTAYWRDENPHTEPGSPQLAEARQSTPSELPESWVSVGVGSVIDNLKYGTAQKCGYEKEGAPVLRIPNIADGVIDHSDVKYALLRETKFEQLRLNPGDILLIRSNGSVSLVGKSALIREPEKAFAYAGYLIRLRPNRSRVLPEYLNLALSSYDVRLQIEIPARSTSGVHNINSEEVRRLRISLPPLAEQNEIVRRVETLFKLAGQIEARLSKAQAQVDKLTQSFLAKAFRGELVPTEAELARREGHDYEPAPVLLERIRTGGKNEAAAQPTPEGNRIQERRVSNGTGRRK